MKKWLPLEKKVLKGGHVCVAENLYTVFPSILPNTILYFYSPYKENGRVKQIPLTLLQNDINNLIFYTGNIVFLFTIRVELGTQSSRTRFAYGRLFPCILVLFYVIKTALHHIAQRQLQLFRTQTDIKHPTANQSWNNKNQTHWQFNEHTEIYVALYCHVWGGGCCR
jgi:hypothetical protein